MTERLHVVKVQEWVNQMKVWPPQIKRKLGLHTRPEFEAHRNIGGCRAERQLRKREGRGSRHTGKTSLPFARIYQTTAVLINKQEK